MRFSQVLSTPKEIKLNWNLTVEDIQARTKTLIEKAEALENQIATLPLEEVSYDTVLLPMTRLSKEMSPDC